MASHMHFIFSKSNKRQKEFNITPLTGKQYFKTDKKTERNGTR